jgi:hypothetical protein
MNYICNYDLLVHDMDEPFFLAQLNYFGQDEINTLLMSGEPNPE